MNIYVFCEKVGVDKDSLISKSRKYNISNLRQIYCFLCREYYNIGLEKIGRRVNRSHGTVIHSVNKVKDLISIRDKDTIKTLELLGYAVEV